MLLSRTARSPHRRVPFDWVGQVTAVVAMGGLTYGAIEAGAAGFTAPQVLAAFAVAAAALAAFLAGAGPRGAPDGAAGPVPLARPCRVAVAVGFAFVVGYYGLPFVMSLYLQQLRGLSSLDTGLVFLPMMLIGLRADPVQRPPRRAARAPGRWSPPAWSLMAAGLVALASCRPRRRCGCSAALMVLVGLAGPLVMPPVTALLLNGVPAHRAGTASGVFNTSRQLGGALAVAVFGALLAAPAGFLHGLRASLLIAAALALAAAAASLRLAGNHTARPA